MSQLFLTDRLFFILTIRCVFTLQVKLEDEVSRKWDESISQVIQKPTGELADGQCSAGHFFRVVNTHEAMQAKTRICRGTSECVFVPWCKCS